jgi:hypothetical protein
MTDIEFKVQFVSESFSGKGSCKGTVFKETPGQGCRARHPAGPSRAVSLQAGLAA